MIKAVIFDMYETLITLYESPLYFGTQMAEDAGITEEHFQSVWCPAERDRAIGKISLEELLEKILKMFDCYSEEKMRLIIDKRINSRKEAFNHLNPEIVPLLEKLRERGIKIGLVSNCFSEEAAVIKDSELFKYFDEVCLSYDEGIQKPDLEIFNRCIEKLQVKSEECLYVGDGGSNELDAAATVGMKSVQAIWYLKEETMQPARKMKDFVNVKSPMDILELVNEVF